MGSGTDEPKIFNLRHQKEDLSTSAAEGSQPPPPGRRNPAQNLSFYSSLFHFLSLILLSRQIEVFSINQSRRLLFIARDLCVFTLCKIKRAAVGLTTARGVVDVLSNGFRLLITSAALYSTVILLAFVSKVWYFK